MEVDPTLYYFLVGSFAAVSTVAIYLLIIYSLTSKRVADAQKKSDELTDATKREYNEIIWRAQSDYENLISAANKRAQEIIDQATRLNEQSQAVLDSGVKVLSEKEATELEKVSQKLVEEHKEAIKKVTEDNINLLNNVSKDILKYAQDQIDSFKEALKQQTIESERLAQEKVNAEYQKIEDDLAKYRERTVKKLEENIYNIIFNVSKDIIGTSLDMSQHEKLIEEALEKAKREIKT